MSSQVAPRHNPSPVKLLIGLLHPVSEPRLLDWSRASIEGRFGAIERESDAYPFGYTDYYDEISPRLNRVFFSFAGLRSPEELVSWKLAAIEIEAASVVPVKSGRRVNVDPGYLDGARLVLASTKDNAHRVYIARGIYAEVTLCRRKKGWERFPYTFPDFGSGVYDAFLELVRQDWRRDARVMRAHETEND